MPTELELIALETEFDLYLPFSKRLVLNLPNSDDRVRAAQWLQKLRTIHDDNYKKLRNEHLKLLLFALHRRSLVGIFEVKPPKDELESFHDGLTLLEMTRELIEITEARASSGANAADPLACPLPPVWTNLSFDLKEYSAMQHIPKFGAHCFYAVSNEPIQFWRKSYGEYPGVGDIPNSLQWEKLLAKISDHVLEKQAEMDRRINIMKAIEKGEATEDELYPDIDFSKKIEVQKCPDEVFKWKTDSPLQLHQNYDFSDVGIAEDIESQGKEQLELDEQAFQVLDSSLPGRQRIHVREPYFYHLPGDIVERRNHGVDDNVAEDAYDYELRIQMMKKICPVFLERGGSSNTAVSDDSTVLGRGYMSDICKKKDFEEPPCCKELDMCSDNTQSGNSVSFDTHQNVNVRFQSDFTSQKECSVLYSGVNNVVNQNKVIACLPTLPLPDLEYLVNSQPPNSLNSSQCPGSCQTPVLPQVNCQNPEPQPKISQTSTPQLNICQTSTPPQNICQTTTTPQPNICQTSTPQPNICQTSTPQQNICQTSTPQPMNSGFQIVPNSCQTPPLSMNPNFQWNTTPSTTPQSTTSNFQSHICQTAPQTMNSDFQVARKGSPTTTPQSITPRSMNSNLQLASACPQTPPTQTLTSNLQISQPQMNNLQVLTPQTMNYNYQQPSTPQTPTPQTPTTPQTPSTLDSYQLGQFNCPISPSQSLNSSFIPSTMTTPSSQLTMDQINWFNQAQQQQQLNYMVGDYQMQQLGQNPGDMAPQLDSYQLYTLQQLQMQRGICNFPQPQLQQDNNTCK
ncbi:uncharacterized protein LOC142331947 [Lycorma delicatula]|uniref:uncharacterized protein LOC142331947 n=1 Tax=Lycorma delicatula TaxID=130591 RepID=UPI003F51204F